MAPKPAPPGATAVEVDVMSSNAVSAKTFESVKRLHCGRWSDRSLEVARALLVDGERVTEVAGKFGMSRQQANVLRTRFLALVNSPSKAKATKVPIKVPAERFMRAVEPESPPALRALRNEIRQLVSAGYSEHQINEFLLANDVTVSAQELTAFLGAME